MAHDDHWSGYWSAGYFHSLPTTYFGNYHGALLAWWERAFCLFHSNSRIMDLATGNGALAVLAAEYSYRNDLSFEVTGIDSAKINAAVMLAAAPAVSASIRLFGDTPIESVSDNRFNADAVISQFGIEYSDLPKSLPVVAERLAAGGHMAFIMHCTESILVARSKRDAAIWQAVLASGLFESFSSLSLAQEDSSLAGDCRNCINDAVASLVGHYDSDPLLQSVLGAVSEQWGMRRTVSGEQLHGRFKQFELEGRQCLHRLTDMQSAALTEAQFSWMKDRVRALGFRILCAETIQDAASNVLAVTLHAVRDSVDV